MNIGLILLIVTLTAMVILAVLQNRAKRSPLTNTRGGSPSRVTLAMQITVSAVLLAAALYIILWGKYDDGTQKFAFGAVGTVIGFWLKPST